MGQRKKGPEKGRKKSSPGNRPWRDDPRDRWHVLARVIEEDYRDELVAIDRWPVGERPARMIAAGNTVEEVAQVAKVWAKQGATITVHTTMESRVPCVLVAQKAPEVRIARR